MPKTRCLGLVPDLNYKLACRLQANHLDFGSVCCDEILNRKDDRAFLQKRSKSDISIFIAQIAPTADRSPHLR
ncbi:MAG: hypothetical protein ACRC62_21960 [Microcoleus sp.]